MGILYPWVLMREVDEDGEYWWDCECSAYDGEESLGRAIASANSHGYDCGKGKFRWQQQKAGK